MLANTTSQWSNLVETNADTRLVVFSDPVAGCGTERGSGHFTDGFYALLLTELATEDLPYFILDDDAFPLCSWLMKPFPGRHLTHEEKIF